MSDQIKVLIPEYLPDFSLPKGVVASGSFIGERIEIQPDLVDENKGIFFFEGVKVLSFRLLNEVGFIPKYEQYNTKEKFDRVYFVSHRWMSPVKPDPENEHYKILQHLYASGVLSPKDGVIYDYASFPQKSGPLKTQIINSINKIQTNCDGTIVITNESYFDRGWCILEAILSTSTMRLILVHNPNLAESSIRYFQSLNGGSWQNVMMSKSKLDLVFGETCCTNGADVSIVRRMAENTKVGHIRGFEVYTWCERLSPTLVHQELTGNKNIMNILSIGEQQLDPRSMMLHLFKQ